MSFRRVAGLPRIHANFRRRPTKRKSRMLSGRQKKPDAEHRKGQRSTWHTGTTRMPLKDIPSSRYSTDSQ